MTRTFRITYQTSWGEEIKLISGEKQADMHYLPGGIWETSLPGKSLPAGAEYHYECWKDGRRVRREWKNHIVPDTKETELYDQWTDIPAAAPFFTSAFADKVFSIDQDSFKVNEEATPQDMYRSGWKCAGTAVPVFSLRTEDSFGIGDFHDLKKLVDWVAATGQRVIQLLPVNDTTMTGTWTDSYPYSANSIYALHPQFVYLPDAGVRRDAKYKALKAELEALTEIDYERVNQEKDRLMRKAFASTWAKVSVSEEYQKFIKDNAEWLDAYCAFRILLHKTGTGDSAKWGKYATYSAKKAASVLAENREEADYQSFVQFHLHKQLVDARNYARKHGVTFKGDLPIGVSRTSVDAWQHPSQFNMNSQAGAPPDAFSADGQLWGFPTYNWDKMEEDNFAWWKARLKNMEQYFDFFRIDHILGFSGFGRFRRMRRAVCWDISSLRCRIVPKNWLTMVSTSIPDGTPLMVWTRFSWKTRASPGIGILASERRIQSTTAISLTGRKMPSTGCMTISSIEDTMLSGVIPHSANCLTFSPAREC